MGLAVLLVLLVPLACLGTAVAGALCAADTGGAVGFVKYLAALTVSFLWMFLGAIIFSCLGCRSSLGNLALYAPWCAAGMTPFCLSLRRAGNDGSRIGRTGAILGMAAGVLFCVVSAVPVCFGAGNGEDHLHVLCFFFLIPAGLFLSAFALTALGLGSFRKLFFGVIENLLLLAIAPAGLFVVMAVSLWSVASAPGGRGDTVPASIALAVWLLCMFVPYGYMTLRGRRKKDELGFYNGIAGLGAVVFFLLGLGLLGYIGRGV